MGKIIKPLLILVAFALVIAFAVSWILSIIGLFYTAPFLQFLFPDKPYLSILGVGNILFLIGIPVVGIVVLLLNPVYGTRLNSYWKVGLWVFWAMNLSSLFITGMFMAKQFSAGGKRIEKPALTAIQTDTLKVMMTENPYEEVWTHITENLKMSGEDLVSNDIRLNIITGDTGNYSLTVEYYTRGDSPKEANKIAERIEYPVEAVGNHLILPSYFIVSKGEKWRAQQVRLFLRIPPGKSVQFAPSAYNILHDVEQAPEATFFWDKPQNVWTMSAQGLYCPSCQDTIQE